MNHKHKGQDNSKVINCSGCGTPTKVGSEAVAVKCWRCVNEMLRGYSIEKDPTEPEQKEEKS
jgi:hypothetical protein